MLSAHTVIIVISTRFGSQTTIEQRNHLRIHSLNSTARKSLPSHRSSIHQIYISREDPIAAFRPFPITKQIPFGTNLDASINPPPPPLHGMDVLRDRPKTASGVDFNLMRKLNIHSNFTRTRRVVIPKAWPGSGVSVSLQCTPGPVTGWLY